VVTTQALKNKLYRETAARHCAEQLLEDKSGELYKINQELLQRNQKIDQQGRRLHRQIIELEETRQQLVQSEKMAVIGQLTAGVAHEINNPVAFIASNLETLSDYLGDIATLINKQKKCVMKFKIDHISNTSSTVRLLDDLCTYSHSIDVDGLLDDALDRISESVDGTHRVKKIVADLSDFSYLNTPDARAEDINDLLKKSVNIASSELKYKADMEWCLAEIPLVVCHEGKIGQVFLNLLVNAAHAIHGYGLIRLSTGREGDRVFVEIADNGCGISEDDLANIFDPFFTTKDIGKGTGLGLHVVKTAVEMHGGEILVSSTDGCGAIFKIMLPIAGVTR
jgi:two-component system NtrC family sensor kinase